MTDTWKAWLEKREADELIGLLEHMKDEPWSPSASDCQAAWTFCNELHTRVISEPLRYKDGDELAALTSIYKLFEITRSILDKHGRCARHFAILARTVLNHFIRPFTSKWHRNNLRGYLDHQDHRRLFRRDLTKLQQKLNFIAILFGELAEGESYVQPIRANSPSPRSTDFNACRIWPKDFLGPDTIPENCASLVQILEDEQSYIQKRREQAYGDKDQQDYGGLGKASNESESMGTFGLAISGGGIRSATFALGALQQLAEAKILKDVDYLSTVSGGSYIGSFLTSRMHNEDFEIDKILVPDHGAVETEEVRNLRNRSKYLKSDEFLRTMLARAISSLARPLPIIFGLLSALAFILGTPAFIWIIGAGFLFLFLNRILRANLNRFSLHRLYRHRLASAYIDPDKMHDSPKLSDLRASNRTPYHLICAAVNLPSSKNPELRGRRSDFFIFSPNFCGSILTGYSDTQKLEKTDPDLDLATAMAISGAAVSPHMGTLRRWRIVRLILMLFRLSYWLPNPRYIESQSNWDRPGLRQLLREAVGFCDENAKFVNLSDGGHIENLGIYELLRRRCKFIVCIDGEQDPKQTCSALIKACPGQRG